jgi:hypothetical protein
LITAKKKATRASGVTLLFLYLLTSIALGMLVRFFASIYN